MANVVKTQWFGKRISVLMVNGESLAGELTEVSDNYVVLDADDGQVQVMIHAIVTVRPAAGPREKMQPEQPAPGVPTFDE